MERLFLYAKLKNAPRHRALAMRVCRHVQKILGVCSCKITRRAMDLRNEGHGLTNCVLRLCGPESELKAQLKR